MIFIITAIMCPPLSWMYEYEEIQCTDENRWGSTCTFICIEGYGIVGSQTLTCEDDEWESSPNGQWSDPEPYCEGIVCVGLFIIVLYKR